MSGPALRSPSACGAPQASQLPTEERAEDRGGGRAAPTMLFGVFAGKAEPGVIARAGRRGGARGGPRASSWAGDCEGGPATEAQRTIALGALLWSSRSCSRSLAAREQRKDECPSRPWSEARAPRHVEHLYTSSRGSLGDRFILQELLHDRVLVRRTETLRSAGSSASCSSTSWTSSSTSRG